MNAHLNIVTADVESLSYGRDEDGWEHNAYRVTLRYQGRQMTTPYKTGLGWTNAPTAADVLESLLSDASSIENGNDFEDWASNYGFNPDSRKAEAIYKATVKQTNKLRRLLGDDFDAAVFPEGDEDSDQVAARLTTA